MLAGGSHWVLQHRLSVLSCIDRLAVVRVVLLRLCFQSLKRAACPIQIGEPNANHRQRHPGSSCTLRPCGGRCSARRCKLVQHAAEHSASHRCTPFAPWRSNSQQRAQLDGFVRERSSIGCVIWISVLVQDPLSPPRGRAGFFLPSSSYPAHANQFCASVHANQSESGASLIVESQIDGIIEASA